MKNNLDRDLNKNIQIIKSQFNYTTDLMINRFTLNRKMDSCAISIKGITDEAFIMQQLLNVIDSANKKRVRDLYHHLSTVLSPIDISQKLTAIDDIILFLCDGGTLLLFEDIPEAILVQTSKLPERSIKEPTSEAVTSGPKEGFVENIITNQALLRKRIKTPDFILEAGIIGLKTKSKIKICYIKNLVDNGILEDVKKRLSNIRVDGIFDANIVAELLFSPNHSLFPKVNMSERPDIVAAKLLEGKIVILVDGSPRAIILPVIFIDFFNGVEDNYLNASFISIARFIRYTSFFITMLFPAIFLALVNYHPSFIPNELLLSIVSAQKGTPFPIYVELLVMLLLFELLKEASIRMPAPFGSTVSIFGAVILGDAAIKARLVGAPTTIVISITVIALTAIPNREFANSILFIRLASILLALFFGLVGIMVCLSMVTAYMCSIESFGKPYFLGFAPKREKGIIKTLLRTPHKNDT